MGSTDRGEGEVVRDVPCETHASVALSTPLIPLKRAPSPLDVWEALTSPRASLSLICW